jgi:hypothetical protein
MEEIQAELATAENPQEARAMIPEAIPDWMLSAPQEDLWT